MSPAAGLDIQPHLIGDLIELRPLHPDDWDALFAVASDPLIWELHPQHDRYKEEVFRGFFQDALSCKGAFVAIDRKTNKIVGSSRYFWHGPGELEIGWTFLARSHWGGVYNQEMKRLMIGHAFQAVDHVIFLVGENNVRSRRALEKIGATLTDRRIERSLNGLGIDHVIYQIHKPPSA